MSSPRQLSISQLATDSGELSACELVSSKNQTAESTEKNKSPISDNSPKANKKPSWRSVDKDSLAPMLRAYVEMSETYPEHLILFQVGDFFEVFFDNAEVVSDILSIRLTSRNKDQANAVAMCGVPIHALTTYLPKLVNAGHSVVVVRQVETPGSPKTGPKKNVKREIERIVTPGVRLEEDGLEETESNFVAAVCFARGTGCLAWIDVTAGTLRVYETESYQALVEKLRLVSPAEAILPSRFFGLSYEDRGLKRECSKISCSSLSRPFVERKSQTSKCLPELVGSQADCLGPVSGACIEALLEYIEEVSFDSRLKVHSLEIEDRDVAITIDAGSLKNLEVFQSQGFSKEKNSLVSVIDRCRTPMGKRLLRFDLLRPLNTKPEILKRLEAVDSLVKSFEVREQLRSIFSGVRDLERLASKLAAERINPYELRLLCDSLLRLPDIRRLIDTLDSELLKEKTEGFEDFLELSQLLDRGLSEQPASRPGEGEVIKRGFNSELDRLRDISGDREALLRDFETKLKERVSVNGLRLKFNSVLGYFLEVPKASAGKLPEYFERRQTLTNVERYFTKELKELEQEILSAKEKEQDLEREEFLKLRSESSKSASSVFRMAGALARIDLSASAAETAANLNYCKPEMSEEPDTYIEEGRHPIVEQIVGSDSFVANSLTLNSVEGKFAVLTGPNMGGKSTFLRQVGLISLLAQIGQFVPARKAKLGIADRIFTRIGASDDMSQGESTFMVEMREASVIVRKASSKSLVLVDELGRGTETGDGFALARAISEYLSSRVACRTLFATHFHRLGVSDDSLGDLQDLSVGVVEEKGELKFSYRIIKGRSEKSYGLEVARLAGLPEILVARAKVLLNSSRAKDLDSAASCSGSRGASDSAGQAELEPLGASVEVSKVETLLEELDPNHLSPIEALNSLVELKALGESSSRKRS